MCRLCTIPFNFHKHLQAACACLQPLSVQVSLGAANFTAGDAPSSAAEAAKLLTQAVRNNRYFVEVRGSVEICLLQQWLQDLLAPRQ